MIERTLEERGYESDPAHGMLIALTEREVVGYVAGRYWAWREIPPEMFPEGYRKLVEPPEWWVKEEELPVAPPTAPPEEVSLGELYLKYYHEALARQQAEEAAEEGEEPEAV